MDHKKHTNSSLEGGFSVGSQTGKKEEFQGATAAEVSSSVPESASHNVNDLKMFDFNSADEVRSRAHAKTQITSGPIFVQPFRRAPISVRQAMKAMLSGNKPQNPGDEMKPKETTEPEVNKAAKSDSNETGQSGNVFKIVNSKEEPSFSSNVRKKRRGRPPNAGPSKKTKETSVTNLYNGKLNNVVHFNSASESDSDDYFY